MAKVEIEESELQNARQLSAAIAAINKHPEGGLLLEQAYKAANPDAKTPRLDQHKQANQPLEELKKEFSEFRKKTEDEKAEAEKNAKLIALQAKIDSGNAKLKNEGWTDDGIKLLDKFREDQGILDPIAAASYYEKLNGPQVIPATPSSHYGRWDFGEVQQGQEDYSKKLLDTKGDSETLVMQEAMKALKELRGGQGR